MKRVLIIRFSSIGDIVLTTPVVRCLKEQIPGAEIHYLTKTQNFPILQANPYITKIWLYDKNFRELIPQLKFQGFDFIADLHKNHRSRFVKNRLAVSSATFPKLDVEKWLLVNLRINLLPKVHIADRYFHAVQLLEVRNDNKGLDYFIPQEEEFSLATLPEAFAREFIAIAIGAKHNTKIFPVEKIAEVISLVRKPVILLGGREDRERGEEIIRRAGKNVFNACGFTSLNQSASIIRQASSVLTNDTGMMHIAAAFGKRIVSVWGNTIPAFGMYPYMKSGDEQNSFVSEVNGLSCRPCSKLGYPTCPKKHFKCMNLIDTAEIAKRL
ncbi:MAG: glycosyltransferase family 9 protein [bacterium]